MSVSRVTVPSASAPPSGAASCLRPSLSLRGWWHTQRDPSSPVPRPLGHTPAFPRLGVRLLSRSHWNCSRPRRAFRDQFRKQNSVPPERRRGLSRTGRPPTGASCVPSASRGPEGERWRLYLSRASGEFLFENVNVFPHWCVQNKPSVLKAAGVTRDLPAVSAAGPASCRILRKLVKDLPLCVWAWFWNGGCNVGSE